MPTRSTLSPVASHLQDNQRSSPSSRAADPRFRRTPYTWLAFLLLAYFAYLQAAFGPLLPFLKSELGLSYTLAGLHFSAFALGAVIAGVATARVARIFAREHVLWGGGIGMAAGTLALCVGAGIQTTLSGALLMGAAGTAMVVLIQSTLSDAHGEHRATALTEANVCASLSATMAPILVGGCQRLGVGWRWGLLLMVALFVLVVVWGRTIKIPERCQSNDAVPRQHHRRLPGLFWLYWTAIVLGVSAEWCLGLWAGSFLQLEAGMEKASASMAVSLFFLAMMLGRVVGSLATRVIAGHRLLVTALVLTMCGFPLFWLGGRPSLTLPGLFICGLGIANCYPLILAVATGLVPQLADTASARVSLAGGLAILIAPLILGRMADDLGIKHAYGLVAVLLVSMLMLVVVANRRAEQWRYP